MSTEAASIALVSAKLDLVLARLDELNHAGKPGLTQTEFAKLIGKHPSTVRRWVADKTILLEKGVIPHSEVRKYLS
jgi:DNA-binding IclR family transcriptional regulator